MTEYSPVIDNLYIRQGFTFGRQYPVSGVVMAGATVKAQARAWAGDDTVAIEFTALLVADDPGVPAGQSGVVNLTLTASTTGALTPGWYVWDARLVTAGGTSTTSPIAQGSVFVDAGVTRDD